MLTDLLIKNIRCLVQTEDVVKLKVPGNEMSKLNTLTDAFLFMQDGIINDFGKMKDLKSAKIPVEDRQIEVIDASSGREGKVANIFITREIPSYEFMPYAFGSTLIETVILRGKIIRRPQPPL